METRREKGTSSLKVITFGGSGGGALGSGQYRRTWRAQRASAWMILCKWWISSCSWARSCTYVVVREGHFSPKQQRSLWLKPSSGGQCPQWNSELRPRPPCPISVLCSVAPGSLLVWERPWVWEDISPEAFIAADIAVTFKLLFNKIIGLR